MNARNLALVAVAALAPVAASAGTVSVGSAYAFDLTQVDGQYVAAENSYRGVDGYFAGSQTLQLGGFTAATGLSIDRLESVTLRIEGRTASIGSGGVYAATGASVLELGPGFQDRESFATERDAVGGRGINLINTGNRGSTFSLAGFASDTIDVGVYTAIAFYGEICQVDHADRGFTSSGFAVVDYTFSDGPSLATAVPTPSAALAGLIGLGGVSLKRRRKA